MKTWAAVSVCILAAFFGACGSSTATTPDAGVLISCQNDPRAQTYAPNLTVTSDNASLKFVLVQSNPAPPSRGTDEWTLRITNPSGTALDNLAVTVVPFMPDHGHGTSVNATVTANADGTYTANPLYLFMPGVWRITFTTTPPGGASDTAEFFFCIAG
jgi:hypothetical protein